MLDLKFLRENPEVVKENIKRNLVQQKQNAVYGEKVAELKAKYMEV